MTKLLVKITEPDEFSLLKDIDADILSILFTLASSISHDALIKKNSAELFFELTEQQLLDGIENSSLDLADGLCLFVPDSNVLKKLAAIKSSSLRHKFIACLSFKEAADTALISSIAAFGFKGIWLRPKAHAVHFLQETNITALGDLILIIRQHGLMVGLSGMLEAPDIPRLLPFMPDWLGFCIKELIGADNEIKKLITMLIPDVSKKDNVEGKVQPVTDRLLVRDFILPMEIGAYAHEKGHKQRVCFNISADVQRLSSAPEDMSHIFSYDLILDGIRSLVSHGHIALVETLAERIAAFILNYPQVRNVVVRVEKLDLGPAAVGVEIKRNKEA